MKILVTGAAGYIARWLVPELRRGGHEVTGTDLPVDLIEPGTALRVLEETEPELVVHLAAGIGRERCEADWSATIRANAEMTVQVARACSSFGARMLHVSTSEVYGPSEYPLGAHAFLKPINLYGMTKKWAEEAAVFYANASVARLSMPYGPGSAPGPGRCALHNFLWDAWNGRPLVVHGHTMRSWCWAGDTARGLRYMIERTDPAKRITMNVGRSDDLRSTADVAELAMKIVTEMGGPPAVSLVQVESPSDVTPVKDYDTSPLLALGWVPTVELEQGMIWTLAYLTENYSS